MNSEANSKIGGIDGCRKALWHHIKNFNLYPFSEARYNEESISELSVDEIRYVIHLFYGFSKTYGDLIIAKDHHSLHTRGTITSLLHILEILELVKIVNYNCDEDIDNMINIFWAGRSSYYPHTLTELIIDPYASDQSQAANLELFINNLRMKLIIMKQQKELKDLSTRFDNEKMRQDTINKNIMNVMIKLASEKAQK